MSRPSKKRLRANRANKTAETRERRAKDVEAIMERDLADALEDFVLVICDDCGLEQSSSPAGCLVCGCKTSTTSPNHEATVAKARALMAERANL